MRSGGEANGCCGLCLLEIKRLGESPYVLHISYMKPGSFFRFGGKSSSF